MAKDIISTLSDFLLCHILSFLEAKHVVATAVLSKRWSNLWLYVHILEFYARLTDENANFRFNDFVYSVLLSRDPAISIKRFKLFVDYDCEEDLNLPTLGFAKWINYVIQRGVQHLDLFLDLPSIPKLPNTIFSCKTLWLHSEDSLSCNKWKNFILSNLIDANVDSSYFHFPLKTLHNVQYLEISIAKMHSFSDFIPTFHNLTYLHLSCLNYRWHFLVEVLKHCPNLQDLDIDEAGAYATEETWTRKDDKENWMDPDFVPQCLSLHLRNCHLLNFFGLQGIPASLQSLNLVSDVIQDFRVDGRSEASLEARASSDGDSD
ncbi:F-box/LRR-repeat protein [Trifolium pratense]|uniref:F-box/LRR-repeat protein n=1 Tax=Trifolium pratense TaxID=57577 RepID=A0A2K3P198_TRIPR|nr:F-box/LRR-repeat protein [Trifolium pratense]